MNSQNRLSFEYEFGNESLIQIFHSLNTKQTSILPFAVTSQTPYEYLLNYRLQQAQRMLIETTKSVNEISHLAGFTESKGFIACFKNKTGITPLQFRKQNYIT